MVRNCQSLDITKCRLDRKLAQLNPIDTILILRHVTINNFKNRQKITFSDLNYWAGIRFISTLLLSIVMHFQLYLFPTARFAQRSTITLISERHWFIRLACYTSVYGTTGKYSFKRLFILHHTVRSSSSVNIVLLKEIILLPLS